MEEAGGLSECRIPRKEQPEGMANVEEPQE